MGIDGIVIATFVVLGAVFVAATFATSWLVSPKKPSPEKAGTYECGVEPVGPVWVQFRVGYYVYALLFVVFDVEAIFLYPWAIAFAQPGIGWFIFVEMFIFITIIVGGLAYAWKEQALKWR